MIEATKHGPLYRAETSILLPRPSGRGRRLYYATAWGRSYDSAAERCRVKADKLRKWNAEACTRRAARTRRYPS